MKTTIKLIRNILEKFNLIANLTAKNLALHQQLTVMSRLQKDTNKGQRSSVLGHPLSLLE